jgi:hypothetical protein
MPRPAKKNSEALLPARLVTANPTTRLTTKNATTIDQSPQFSVIGSVPRSHF